MAYFMMKLSTWACADVWQELNMKVKWSKGLIVHSPGPLLLESKSLRASSPLTSSLSAKLPSAIGESSVLWPCQHFEIAHFER